MLDAAIETPKLLTTLILIGLEWVIGEQLTVLWSRRQKQNEQDLDAARDFHALYGEFFALWMLWNYYVRDLGAEALLGASRWQLLDHACGSEAKLESTLVRLASEKSLTKKMWRHSDVFGTAISSCGNPSVTTCHCVGSLGVLRLC